MVVIRQWSALISQILYEAIDEGDEIEKPQAVLSLKMRQKEVVKENNSKFKQFLTEKYAIQDILKFLL